jgi:YegS/Rv2252/BmrU family lipid kinase
MFGNTLLIVNPTAQSGRARKALREVSELLSEATNTLQGHYYEIIETTYPLDAVIIAHELGDHFDTVFVLGGDGVVHETVNGLMQLEADKRPKLGVLPAGQGNDFARSLNLPLDPLKALKDLLKLHEKTIDIGKVNNSYFAETLSFGIDAAIALETMQRRHLTNKTGTILYLESGLNQIKNHLHAIKAHVTIDDTELPDLEFYTFAVQNGQTYGGGFDICPQANLSDGLFDICYATPPLSKFEAARLFMRAKDGKHLTDKHIHFKKGSKIKLVFSDIVPAQIDGEPIPAYEYDISVMPQALNVLSL